MSCLIWCTYVTCGQPRGNSDLLENRDVGTTSGPKNTWHATPTPHQCVGSFYYNEIEFESVFNCILGPSVDV